MKQPYRQHSHSVHTCRPRLSAEPPPTPAVLHASPPNSQHTYTYTYTHTYTHTHTHSIMHTRHTHMHTCTHTHIHTHTQIHSIMHTRHTHAYVYTHTHIHIYTQYYAHSSYMRIHTRTYTYTHSIMHTRHTCVCTHAHTDTQYQQFISMLNKLQVGSRHDMPPPRPATEAHRPDKPGLISQYAPSNQPAAYATR